MLLNPFVGTSAVGSAGGAYFFEERFEGAGYQNTWDETGATGTVDEDYTTSPLEGAQSLLLSGTAQKPTTTAILPSDQAELWVFFKLRIDTPLSANRRIFSFKDTIGTFVGSLTLGTDNKVAILAGTNSSAFTVDAMTTGTNYNIWLHFTKGTGANSFGSVGFSSGTTEVTAGNAFRNKSDGDAVADAHSVTLTTSAAVNTTGALVFDQLLMSTTGTIGDNPA